ncbi:phosphoribosylaminoimidazolesuccinocarboxamide synthase [Haloglycomyces albus]|uniref:phosphoribosylaminoimidazolesuccinocarboxamide synthase n=1 Tax=Haloglycomyces albus TaxID=526067 RepID=UPI00046D221A|nr:phosphoribosylaminoimidazolesuccinocarboxamide synthase [Haloglycomyces albus]
MELVHQGKVRDVYADGDDLILVASDRVSVYDVVLPTPIPDKGKLLTQLSLWWFEQLADVIDNHIVSAEDVPPEFRGRAVRVRRLRMLPVEAIVRGYLTGSGLADYQKTGSVCGIALPQGLMEASRLAEPIFTPTTKAAVGEHDQPIDFASLRETVGVDLAERIRERTLEIYRRGAATAWERGIVIADTKLEFGLDDNDRLVLADELLTSDSSRFWDAAEWKEGHRQASFDKQNVRDWIRSTGWQPGDEVPEIPTHVVSLTHDKYVAAYERITGLPWRG